MRQKPKNLRNQRKAQAMNPTQNTAESKRNSVGYMHYVCDFTSPFNTQESWDNSGLNLGSLTQEFDKLYITLEVTHALAHSVSPNSLIIAHHPLFFKSIKSFDTASYPCNIARELIAKNCALIAMHTNFDKSHLNEYFTHQILGFSHFVQDSLYCHGAIEKTPFAELANALKAKLGLESLRVCQASESIEHIFVICGSGFSEIAHIAALTLPNSLLISGDLKYHDAMIAKSLGLSLIDIPHYESEKYFTQIFHSLLKNAGYQAIITDCKNPITHI